jgi:phage replication O-like protein O
MADKPNWTEVPNALMELMPYLPDAECRVMLVIARKTHGYHKTCDVISYSQLTNSTNMSRQGVINGIEGLIKRGILKRTPSGFNNGFCYEILADQVVNEVDHLKQSTKCTGQRSRPLVVNEVDHQVVNEVDPQKKDLKLKERKSVSAPKRTPHTRQTNLDSLSESVLIYKQLTNKSPPPTTTTLIATTVVDMSAWHAAVKGWCDRGFKPGNVEGMIDWYLHPEKQQQRGNTNGKLLRQSANGHSERGKLSETDLEKGF